MNHPPSEPAAKARVAAVQMVSTPDVDRNLQSAATGIAEAAAAGARLVALVDAYEAQWNGAAKTLVSPEWSCVIEDRDEEDMYIKVIRKEDLRML